jgi:hypothetical protein
MVEQAFREPRRVAMKCGGGVLLSSFRMEGAAALF